MSSASFFFFLLWNKQAFINLSLISHIWVHLGTVCTSGKVCKYPSFCQRIEERGRVKKEGVEGMKKGEVEFTSDM